MLAGLAAASVHGLAAVGPRRGPQPGATGNGSSARPRSAGSAK